VKFRSTFLLILLCSCATQRQAEKYFDKNPDKLAKYVDTNDVYTQEYGGAYTAKHFPPRFLPPAVYTPTTLTPQRLNPLPSVAKASVQSPKTNNVICPDCLPSVIRKTVYLKDTIQVQKLQTALNQEKQAHRITKKKLKYTETDRDYWQEMNRKKLWTLIAMAVFAFLYIVFKVLAGKVEEE
jgi:hypothetical protein